MPIVLLLIAVGAAYIYFSHDVSAGNGITPTIPPYSPLYTGQQQSLTPQQTGELSSATSATIGTLEKIAGVGAGATGVGIAGGGASGAGVAGFGLAASVETAGLAALAVLAGIGIGNISRCGTITSIGCTKRADANFTEECIGHARLIANAYFNGQISKAVALAGFAQLATEAQKYVQRPSDYTQAAPGPLWACGRFSRYSPAAFASLGQPADIPNTAAGQAFCGMTGNAHSLQYLLTVGFPALVSNPSNASLYNGGSLSAAIAANGDA